MLWGGGRSPVLSRGHPCDCDEYAVEALSRIESRLLGDFVQAARCACKQPHRVLDAQTVDVVVECHACLRLEVCGGISAVGVSHPCDVRQL